MVRSGVGGGQLEGQEKRQEAAPVASGSGGQEMAGQQCEGCREQGKAGGMQ